MKPHDPIPDGASAGGRPTVEQVRRFVTERIAEMTGMPPERVDASAPIASFGVDSVHAIDLVVRTEEWLGVPLPDNLPWSHPTIEMIAKELGAGEPAA